MELHERIRKYRELKGLTQEGMGIELGIDSVNYGRIERGKAKITIDRLSRIAEILELELDELLGLGQDLPPGQDDLRKSLSNLNDKVEAVANFQEYLFSQMKLVANQLREIGEIIRKQK